MSLAKILSGSRTSLVSQAFTVFLLVGSSTISFWVSDLEPREVDPERVELLLVLPQVAIWSCFITAC